MTTIVIPNWLIWLASAVLFVKVVKSIARSVRRIKRLRAEIRRVRSEEAVLVRARTNNATQDRR